MTWKDDLVYNYFSQEEAEKICSMPLSPRKPDDLIIWGQEKKGFYSVRSAYHFANALYSQDHQDRASTSHTENGWKMIWHSTVIPRIQHFLWRVCVNSFHTKENLRRRNITSEVVCLLCGLHGETGDHLFLHCNEVVNIWKYGHLHLDLSYLNGFSFKQVVWTLLEKLPPETFALFAYIAWNIWKSRNKFLFEQQKFNWKEVLAVAHKSWVEMVDSLKKTTGNKVNANRLHLWRPPPTGSIMMDSDVATFSNGRVGLGIIFRDENGKAIFACRTEIRAIGSTTLLEGIDVRYGLTLAILCKLGNVHVQSDNQDLIRGLHGEIELETYCEMVKEDILDLASRAHVLSFNHIPRNCNRVAHLIARGPSFVGVHNIPSNVLSCVLNEACYML